MPPARQPYRQGAPGPQLSGHQMPVQQTPQLQRSPHMQPAKAAGSGSRQVLIVLAVVLALLVLLCAGVISFLLNQGQLAAKGVLTQQVIASEASYRLGVDGSGPSDSLMTEGRQTL